jgi:hypothetical protein
MKIAVENSTWNNIGDAFYQTSIEAMLSEALPNAEISAFDGPIERAFRPRRFRGNAFDSRTLLQADHFVISGPVIGPSFLDLYGPFIRGVVESGKGYSLLSLHAYSTGVELERIRDFLTRYPPRALHTRDAPTFAKLSGIAPREKNGACFAYFVSYIPGIPDCAPAARPICLSFHNSQEPSISVGNVGADFFDADFQIKARGPSAIPWKFSRHWDFTNSYPTELNGRTVVRPVHSFYPSPHLIFSRPNSYISYNPRTFLSVYKGCEGVITDRVHAAVAALSFGNPALVTKLDGRYALFERAPLERKGDVVRLPRAALEEMRADHLHWLRNDFADALGVRDGLRKARVAV